MPDIEVSKLNIGNTLYTLKDATARSSIQTLTEAVNGGLKFLGVTTTSNVSDGATTNPVNVGGAAVSATNGCIVIKGNKEFIWASNAWHEFGDLSGFGNLALKDTASGSFTPAGTVSQPTFSGNQMTSTGSFTPTGSVTISTGTGSANYTPAGNVSKPNVTVTPTTTTVNSITDVGTLPSLDATYSTTDGGTLTLTFNQGSLPSKGANTAVMTGATAALESAPSFTGTGVQLKASFTGTDKSVTVTGTPSGTVSQPEFTGTQGTVTVS